jgi:hypothetical protein
MSGLAPNSTNIALIRGPVAIANQLVCHPEYQYWRLDWSKVRDCIAGQREIKRKADVYLPKLSRNQSPDDYGAYLGRAVYYNMVGQTLNGMLGQIFRRDPRLEDFPKALLPKLATLAKDGTDYINFTKTAVSEQVGMGRFGVLVDAPAQATVDPDAFVIGYTAENILDWRIEIVNGRYQLTRVLLREFVRKNDARYFSPYTYDTLYRELLLEPDADGVYVYSQNCYFDQAPPIPTVPRVPGATGPRTLQPKYANGPNGGGRGVNKTGFTYENGQPVPHPGVPQPVSTVTPVIRGATLSYIPFVFFGAFSNTADVEKPPLLDIADLNLSHYRSYAELEHGRFYVAMPVYYSPGNDDQGSGEYEIGPNTVWEVPSGQKPGIIEFTGKGLGELTQALGDKERQIAAIGGRLLAGQGGKGSESPDQTQLRQANEYSLLLNVIQACDTGMTLVLRYWMAFLDVPLLLTLGFQFRINTDFLTPNIGAREMRAIQLMYEAGLITIDILYDYLRKADVIPPTLGLDDFKLQLDDPKSFIGQPDVAAMRRGYASRQQELDQATLSREHDFQQQELDLQEQELKLQGQGALPVPKPLIKTPTVAAPALTPGPSPNPKPGSGKEKVAGDVVRNANPTVSKK